jgi:AbiU2
MSFGEELEVFRKEANAAAQFLYASPNAECPRAEHPRVLDHLNDAPVFWNTTIFSLQKSASVALGRIFETDTPHNVARLLKLAEDVSVFSKEALALRKQGTSPTRLEWIDDYLMDVYEPTVGDIRILKKRVGEWRDAYTARYKPLRDKGYAEIGQTRRDLGT